MSKTQWEYYFRFASAMLETDRHCFSTSVARHESQSVEMSCWRHSECNWKSFPVCRRHVNGSLQSWLLIRHVDPVLLQNHVGDAKNAVGIYFRFGSASLENGRQWFFYAPQDRRRSFPISVQKNCKQANIPYG